MILKRYLFCIALALIICSCNKDDDSPKDCSKGELTFKLNDTLWTATSFQNSLVFLEDPTTGINARRCDILATNSAGGKLLLTFTNPNATDDSCVDTGAYISVDNTTATSDNVFFFTYNDGQTTQTIISEGTLNISNCKSGSKEISGTFTFQENVFANLIGTEGSFSVCIP